MNTTELKRTTYEHDDIESKRARFNAEEEDDVYPHDLLVNNIENNNIENDIPEPDIYPEDLLNEQEEEEEEEEPPGPEDVYGTDYVDPEKKLIERYKRKLNICTEEAIELLTKCHYCGTDNIEFGGIYCRSRCQDYHIDFNYPCFWERESCDNECKVCTSVHMLSLLYGDFYN